MKSGFVAIAGPPNVGKSSLLNRLVGEKLAITSPRPQSTRDRITGLLTDGDTQIVFVDTPGLIQPAVELQRAMRGSAIKALTDADVILHLIEGSDRNPLTLIQLAALDAELRAPIVRVRTKSDLLDSASRHRLAEVSPSDILVSARTGEGIRELIRRLGEVIPEGPFLYPADEVSTQNLRFFAAEFIRETTLEQLSAEVPHAVACQVEEFREEASPVYIRAVVFVERASQKRIVIGHKGARIREIGRVARLKIESLVSAPVFLDLWVKVLPNWRRDRNALRLLGYILPEE